MNEGYGHNYCLIRGHSIDFMLGWVSKMFFALSLGVFKPGQTSMLYISFLPFCLKSRREVLPVLTCSATKVLSQVEHHISPKSPLFLLQCCTGIMKVFTDSKCPRNESVSKPLKYLTEYKIYSQIGLLIVNVTITT